MSGAFARTPDGKLFELSGEITATAVGDPPTDPPDPPPDPPPATGEIDLSAVQEKTNFDVRQPNARNGVTNPTNGDATRTATNHTERFWGVEFGAGNEREIGSVKIHGTKNAGFHDQGAGVTVTLEILGFTGPVPEDGAGGASLATVQFVQGVDESQGHPISLAAATWQGIGVKVSADQGGNLNLGQFRAFAP